MPTSPPVSSRRNGARPVPPGPAGRGRRHRARAAAPLLAVAVGACTLVNAPRDTPTPEAPAPESPPPEAVSRSYGGQFSVQGMSLPVVLHLVLRGDAVEEARLSVPELELEATGRGELRGGHLDVRLRYGDGACEGDAQIDADVGEEGRRFEGVLRARDCTGAEEGTLVLLLRPEGAIGAGAGPAVVEQRRSGA